ncbi:MAG: NAAT family transporter [Gammaproteobacteria bacterium]|mgnify:CR=1 FL=1|jgi:multiple antibiotic resistance protein|nr:NAAT family transporter [Gammaproteobacteria bacterium]
MNSFVTEVAAFLLLAFPALFSIINPLGGAFIFLAATRGMSPAVRNRLARKVATYSFFLLVGSMLAGAFVLRFFGISVPVLRVAGGIVIALSAWKMLDASEDTGERDAAVEEANKRDADHMAFYPLTMPVTTGPGTISVAIALGIGETADRDPVMFGVEVLLATGLISLLIYALYRSSSQMSRAVGTTGTTIIARLSSFLLFCIGIQVLWSGVAELIASLPAR